MHGKRFITVLNLLLNITIGLVAIMSSGCGQGSGGTSAGSTPSPTPAAPSLSISMLSSNSPTALTPLYLTTSGLDLTQAFTVGFTAANGISVSLPPIRVQNDGTVVVATPLYVDPATGTTSSIAASVTISQGGLSSPGVGLTILDMPRNSDYGTSLGEISRAFFNYQQLSLGLVQNGFQALQKTPGNTIDTSALGAHVATQLQKEILARSDVDRIIKTNTLQIGTGQLADGTSMSFNSGSVEMMDRVIGMYLTALQPVISTAMPQPPARQVAIGNRRTGGARHDRRTLTPSRVEASGASGITSIVTGLGVLGNIETIANAIRTDWKSDSKLLDRILASEAGAYAGLGIYGALFAGAAAPEIVAAAGVAGLVIGTVQIGVDIYKLATDPNTVLANTNPAASGSSLAAAQSALSSPQGTLLLDATGVALGGLAAKGGVTSLGQQVADFLQQNGSQLGLQTGILVNNTLQLFSNFASSDRKTAEDATAQFQQPFSLPSQGYGSVTGTVSINNSQGPILSALTGVTIIDANSGSQFSSLADENGNYAVTVSLGNTTLNYSMMTINAFDPISSINQGSPFTLASATINLSGLTSLHPFHGPSLSGTCTDPDAGDPDSDDPDCD